MDVQDLPPNWTYYDLKDSDGREISVKHSVGPRPSFSVAKSKWAWHPDHGWLGDDHVQPQYWCHVYVFGWLDADSATPELDTVLDRDRWRFAALSRTEMYQHFVIDRTTPQKTASASTLRSITEFVPGLQLLEKVSDAPPVDNPGVEGVPARRFVRYGAEELGPPVRPDDEVVPERTLRDQADD